MLSGYYQHNTHRIHSTAMASLNPTEKDVISKVPELRSAFNDKYADSISKGLYDPRDLERLNTDDSFTSCFLRTLKGRGDVTKSLAGIDEALKFRKTMGLADLKEEDFPEEMTSRKAMYYKGADKEGNPILYIDVKQNTASGEEQINMLKKYIAFYFDLHYRRAPGTMCVVLMDMSGASTSNVNIDITKFIIGCFTTYFPAYLAYMINYEMPFLLSATWKLISAFLNAEQKQKIRMVKKKEIANFIPEENLWEHMKQ